MTTQIDLTAIFSALILLLVALAVRYLIPLLKERRLQKWAKAAVYAAEMIFKEHGMGAEKFAYVSEYLESKGFHLNAEDLKVTIESAVMELKNALGA